MADDRNKSQDPKKGENQGEGDKRAARHFNEKSEEFVKQTDVEQKAKEAKPKDDKEEQELSKAEAKAAQRAKEHDPEEVRRKGPA
jgi:hypothetical protein